MEKQTALKILQQLANGIDPHSGEVFPADSPYQQPDTIRALFVALHEMGESDVKPRAPARERTATNAGKPWSAEEDQQLASAFDAGVQLAELAAQHQRSRFAIEVRLSKLGKIAPPPNMRGTKAAEERAAYSTQS